MPLMAAAIVSTVLLFLLPRRALPVAALAVLVLVPIGYMDVSRTIGRYFTPAVLITVVWCVRIFFARDQAVPLAKPKRPLLWLPVIGFLAVSTILSTSTSTSISWILVVGLTVMVPYHLGRIRRDTVWPSVQNVFVGIALFLGVLATLDYFFGFNPWTSLYSYDVNEKVWSIFRTRTSLGHPLVTATVASLCVMMALFGNRVPTVLRVLGLIGGGAAVVLAVSRTSVVAVSLGVVLGCVVLLFGRQQQMERSKRALGLFLLIAGSAFVLVVINSPLLAQRNDSSGGLASSLYREQSLNVALSMIRDHWLTGTGPGTAPTIFAAEYDGPLENSALQLTLSLGIPLAAVAMLGVSVFIIRLAARGEAALAAALVAFAVSLVGYSAIDVNPAMLALLTPLMFRAGQVLRPAGSDVTDSLTSVSHGRFMGGPAAPRSAAHDVRPQPARPRA